MSRFALNRHWTFILALSVSLLCCAVSYETSWADGGEIYDTGDPQMGGGGDIFAGDPDVPSGTRKAARLGGVRNPGTISAGDGMSSGSALMWRLHVALLGVRNFYLHF